MSAAVSSPAIIPPATTEATKASVAPPKPPPASGGRMEKKKGNGSGVEQKDDFDILKEKQSEIDANLAGIKATLQRIHAIDMIDKKHAPLLLNSLLEGKELSAQMIQKSARGYISRRDFEHTEEQIPHLIQVTEIRVTDLSEDLLDPFPIYGKFAPDTQVILNSFTRSNCKNWKIYSCGQTSVSRANLNPTFTDNVQLLNAGYLQRRTQMMPKKNFPGKIVVNVFSNKITGNTLIGQAIFDLGKFPDVKAGTEHEIELPLKRLKKGLTIYDAAGNAMTATMDQTFERYEAKQKKYEEDCEAYSHMSTKDKDIKDDKGELLHPEPQLESTEFGTITLKVKMPPAGLDHIFGDFTEICGAWGSVYKSEKWIELDYTSNSMNLYAKPSDDSKILTLIPIERLSIKDIKKVSNVLTSEDVGLFDEDGEPEDLLCIRLDFNDGTSRTFAFGEDSSSYKGLWLSKFGKYVQPEPPAEEEKVNLNNSEGNKEESDEMENKEGRASESTVNPSGDHRSDSEEEESDDGK